MSENIQATPQLLVRWLTSEQMRSLIAVDQIRPSWKHFVPALGKFRSGICFDLMSSSNWRSDHKRIGIVLDVQDIPSENQRHAIEGHKVYCLSEALRWEFDPAKFRERAAEAKKNSSSYAVDPDEMFVLGKIDRLGEKLHGIIVIDAAKRLGPKLSLELQSYSQSNRIPIATMTADEFGSLRAQQLALRQYLAAKSIAMDGTTPGEKALQVAAP